jgi:hypothetical protein
MKNINPFCVGTRLGASHLALGLACASLASACSGYYPLGETSAAGQFLSDDAPVARAEAADARIQASLAPPDVSIATDSALRPGSLASIGDLDGDGRDEMAVASFDFTTQTQFVHVRYGGPRPLDGQEAYAFAESGVHLSMPNGTSNTLRSLGMSGVGDVDADGYGDLLVFTVDCDSTQPDEGVYLVYGGPKRLTGTLPLPSVSTRFVPPARQANPPETQATSCRKPYPASPGDIDGDGFDDVLITRAPQDNQTDGSPIPGTGEGLYIFYGRSQRFSGDVPYTAADAAIQTTERFSAYPLGDINGDGRADLLVSPNWFRPWPARSFLLAGRTERWSGAVDLTAVATALEGAVVYSEVYEHGDLDGDGLDDVLLQDSDLDLHIFYGAPNLFAGGLDFAAADASVSIGAVRAVYPVGDRDGDGDDELLDQFVTADDFELRVTRSNIAFASGSSARLSGNVVFPESDVTAQMPDGRFPEDLTPDRKGGRGLEYAIPAGDLDGDGADDLFTTSYIFHVDESRIALGSPELHIHYGTFVPPTTPLR